MHLNKYICDYCGQECNKGNYVVPALERETQDVYAFKSGIKITQFSHEVMTQMQLDLCENCKIKVARLIELAKYIDLNKHDVCLIDKEEN